MAGGRPSKFKAEYVDQARKLAEIGAIDAEVARFFEVSESTLNLWKEEHPELSESLKAGKNLADSKVVKSLYSRATGYSHPAEKIFLNRDGDIVRAPYTEYYPPETTAGIFWLKNRMRDQWKDKQDLEVSGKDGGPMIAVIKDG